MITPAERNYILSNAYIPEHLPDYVTAVSGTQPVLIEDFVVHQSSSQLIFIGYPLREPWNEARMMNVYEECKTRFSPPSIALIAPGLPANFKNTEPAPPDAYYRLTMPHLVIPPKVRNMLHRAQREISITIGKFTREHKRLLNAFIRNCQCDDATRFIFRRIPTYVQCDHAFIFDARDHHGKLVAFDVADYGARDYAFYMFNIRSQKYAVPGTSDLLLAHIIEHAQSLGKTHLNMGLGINPGIAFFKKKWGATPFIEYASWVQKSPRPGSWWETLDQFHLG